MGGNRQFKLLQKISRLTFWHTLYTVRLNMSQKQPFGT